MDNKDAIKEEYLKLWEKQYRDRGLAMTSEKEYILKRWSDFPSILQGLSDEVKMTVAVLLENQKLLNETEEGIDAGFKRVSIPLVRRIYGGSILHKLASVQTMLSSVDNVTHKGKEYTLCSDFHKLDSFFFPHQQRDVRQQFSLDAEAERTATFANEVRLQIDRHGIKQMSDKAGLQKTIDFKHIKNLDIKAVLELFIKECQALFDRPAANWIVTGPHMANKLNPSNERNEIGKSHIEFHSVLKLESNEIAVWTDTSFYDNKILTGYKGEGDDAGYIYAPYLPLKCLPVQYNSFFIPRSEVLHRYEDIVVDPSYYGTLMFRNLL